MALPNIFHLLLVATIGMAFFSSLSALKCYDSMIGDNVTECSFGEIGCLSIVDCRMGMPDFRGCVNSHDSAKCNMPAEPNGKTWGDLCDCKVCHTDLCNVEKQGLQCYQGVQQEYRKKKCLPNWECFYMADCPSYDPNDPILVKGCVPADYDICNHAHGKRCGACNKCNTHLCNEEPKHMCDSVVDKNECLAKGGGGKCAFEKGKCIGKLDSCSVLDQENCHNATGSVDNTNWDCIWDDAVHSESCMTRYDYCQKYGGQSGTVCKQLKACHWDMDANECVYEV